MNLDEEENLALELDAHTLALLRTSGHKDAYIKWMKDAFNLMERAAKLLRKPKVYAIPGSFGVPTLTLTPPKQLVLPPTGFTSAPPVWIGGKTIEYGDKYQNKYRPWTPKDTRNLIREREAAQKKSRMKISRKGK